jgi:hypothetical protein
MTVCECFGSFGKAHKRSDGPETMDDLHNSSPKRWQNLLLTFIGTCTKSLLGINLKKKKHANRKR